MEWNILLFAGLGLRIFYHISSEDYPYNLWNKIPTAAYDDEKKKFKEGWKNVKQTMFSFILVLITWFLCYYLHFDDTITDGWKLIGLWVLYVTIGWAIDSIFLFLMDMGEKYIMRKIGAKAELPPQP